ncbi:ABC transporter permease subunit [Modestobacter marinus]|uniref:Glycine/betaine ABC transporter permease n=1 Tax=Modestobacter marinus TaxID=477641 RepID=A0A846LEK4_9ACTN|nr:ABC transporter permease [Modestobacter marinus]NIH66116.1 osmoprotectant transport system permease protein [Modestobacter marinus]GGL61203.1 glycine/betaine ABC transporter permease [Modestobacter marinus]
MTSPGGSAPWDLFGYFADHRDEVLALLWSHTWLSVLPVVFGLLLSLPIGWLARRYRWAYPPIVSVTGLLYTIPSLALFVVMPTVLGTQILDPVNVVIALTVYTVALLVRVVADGLAAVPDDVLQSATAMGLTRFQRLRSVELPLAVPVIAAGLRVATVANVSLVAIAATIGIPQLGQLFITGFQLSVTGPYYPPIALGIVLCVLLALALDALIVLGSRLLTPWQRGAVAR